MCAASRSSSLASAVPAASFTYSPTGVSASSDFFEVRGRLRLADVVLEQRSLVQRRGIDVIVIQRERVASRDPSGN